MKDQCKYTNFQLRRMGFPIESRYCVVRKLPFGSFYIGRRAAPPPNFLNLASTYTSKDHCRIDCLENGQILLYDSSTNGTYVNGVNYTNKMIELRENDKIGIGFPINETIRSNGKGIFGFVLERSVIKQEIKEEPENENVIENNEENNLMIDEVASQRTDSPSENVIEIPDLDNPPPVKQSSPPIVAAITEWDPDQPDDKNNFFKFEMDDDMGGWTDDDDDDVVFMGRYSPSNAETTTNGESFDYLNQFSQMPTFDNITNNDEGRRNTQDLLDDLEETESLVVTTCPQEVNIPPISQLKTVIPPLPPQENEVPDKVPTPPPPVESTDDPIPSTSSTVVNGRQEISPVEVLRKLDLDVVLNCLAELYDPKVMIEKLKKIMGEVILDEIVESHNDKKKDDKEREKKSTKNEKNKSSKHSHNHKEKSKDHKSRKLSEHSTFIKDKSSSKSSKRRDSIDKDKTKHRRSSLDVPSTSKKTDNVTFCVEKPSNDIDSPIDRSPEAEPNPTQKNPIVIVRRISSETLNEIMSVSPPPVIEPPEPSTKRKAEEICTSPNPTHEYLAPPEKRRPKADYLDCIQKLRPVPDTIPIEDLFTPSQLPPPLEVVPEAKEPEFNFKLFNKKKERVAHNKVDKDKEKKKEDEKKHNSDHRKKKQEKNGFKIPKISERRQSSSSDNIQSLLDRIDTTLVSNDKTPDTKINKEPPVVPGPSRLPPSKNDPPVVENRFRVPETRSPSVVLNNQNVFAIPKVPPRPVINDESYVPVPPSPLITEEGFKDPRLQNGIVSAMKKLTVIPYNCRDILKDVLSWDVDWIGQVDPPVVDDVNGLNAISNTFYSYVQYVNTIAPLLKLELFQSIVDAYPRKSLNSTIDAELVTSRSVPNEIKFNCDSLIAIQCDISILDHRRNSGHTRKGGLVVITTSSDSNYFGYIARITDNSKSMNKAVKSGLIILVSQKSNIIKHLRQKIKLCFVDYIKVELETFLSLAEFTYSKLSPLILRPNEIKLDRNVIAPEEFYGMEKLNKDQFEALSLITDKFAREWDKPHVFLIEGPPGTGKTRLITNLIIHWMRRPKTMNKNCRILLCAPNNNAVDILTEQLLTFRTKYRHEERKLKLLRFGDKILSKKARDVSIHSLVEADVARECTQVASNEFSEDSEEQRERIKIRNEIKSLNEKLKSATDKQEIGKRLEQLKVDLLKIEKKMYFLRRSPETFEIFKNKAWRRLLDNAEIITCTLASCPSLGNNSNGHFDIAIIDEATQATELATLMAFNFGVRHVIMIGDTQQLPAMVRSPKARDLGFGKSFFARARAAASELNHLTLKTQYRMHPEIMKFSNELFYQNQILNGSCVMSSGGYNLKPYLVFELESEQNFTQNPHCYNTDEIDFVVNLIKTIKGLIHPIQYSIAVVTPYARQKQLIEAKFSDKSVPVFTIDAIQGHEMDIVVFSCVRTTGVGFLCVPERLNVALTRARKGLYICGNFQSLRSVAVWDKLITDAKQRHLFIDEDVTNLNKHLKII